VENKLWLVTLCPYKYERNLGGVAEVGHLQVVLVHGLEGELILQTEHKYHRIHPLGELKQETQILPHPPTGWTETRDTNITASTHWVNWNKRHKYHHIHPLGELKQETQISPHPPTGWTETRDTHGDESVGARQGEVHKMSCNTKALPTVGSS